LASVAVTYRSKANQSGAAISPTHTSSVAHKRHAVAHARRNRFNFTQARGRHRARVAQARSMYQLPSTSAKCAPVTKRETAAHSHQLVGTPPTATSWRSNNSANAMRVDETCPQQRLLMWRLRSMVYATNPLKIDVRAVYHNPIVRQLP
jgi:hypothetical protein